MSVTNPGESVCNRQATILRRSASAGSVSRGPPTSSTQKSRGFDYIRASRFQRRQRADDRVGGAACARRAVGNTTSTTQATHVRRMGVFGDRDPVPQHQPHDRQPPPYAASGGPIVCPHPFTARGCAPRTYCRSAHAGAWWDRAGFAALIPAPPGGSRPGRAGRSSPAAPTRTRACGGDRQAG